MYIYFWFLIQYYSFSFYQSGTPGLPGSPSYNKPTPYPVAVYPGSADKKLNFMKLYKINILYMNIYLYN